jgi:uncharacterized membrane protein
MLDEFALARVIHVLAVVLWIGGVAMVATVLIPAIRTMKSDADQITVLRESSHVLHGRQGSQLF